MKPTRLLFPDRSSIPHLLLLSLPLALLFSRFFPPAIPSTTLTSVRCCGPGCRERAKASEKHYDEKYFAWQTKLGKEKAAETDWSAKLRVKPSDVVADLGAGGGHILATLNVSRRIAVEINPQARAAMEDMYPGKIETAEFPEDLEDESVDVLFTTSAIEHFECPLAELREMGRKVKVGGRVIVGIKNEGPQVAIQVKDDDINQHLYTWNRQLLYNLVKHAGFVVETIEPSDSELLTKALNWKTEQDLRSYKAFIYHWARGVKKVPAPKLG